jgi:hypothetical protein
MAVRTYADDFTDYWADWTARGSHDLTNPTQQGIVNFATIDYTQGATPGDATSTQGLVILPPGRLRFLALFLNNSAFGASRTLDIGWLANTEPDGTAIAADPNGLVAAKDVSAALFAWGFNVLTAFAELNARDPVSIVSTVAGGTIPAAATLKGYLAYAKW